MQQVNSISADTKLCRDLSMVRSYGGKVIDGGTKIYTAKKYVDHIKEVYAEIKDVEIKAVIDLDGTKELADYTAEDLSALKKGELEMLCKEEEEIFADITYSMMNKGDLVEAMAEALAANREG